MRLDLLVLENRAAAFAEDGQPQQRYISTFCSKDPINQLLYKSRFVTGSDCRNAAWILSKYTLTKLHLNYILGSSEWIEAKYCRTGSQQAFLTVWSENSVEFLETEAELKLILLKH